MKHKNLRFYFVLFFFIFKVRLSWAVSADPRGVTDTLQMCHGGEAELPLSTGTVEGSFPHLWKYLPPQNCKLVEETYNTSKVLCWKSLP